MAKRELEKPDLKPVVTGEVKKKERGFFEGLIKEDAPAIGKEIRDDIIIPTLKDMIVNGFKSAIDMLFYGEPQQTYRYNGGRKAGNTNYNSMYSSNYGSGQQARKANPRYNNVEPIEFSSRADADAVCENLDELVERYGQFSIADYYRLSGVPFESTDYNYGWYSMKGIGIVKSGAAWMIDFPTKPTPLD